MTGTTGARGAKRGHGLRLYLERVTGIDPHCQLGKVISASSNFASELV